VPDTGGVVFVPALTGLGAPHWRADARGVIAGIDRGTRAGHIARAALEGIALEVFDLVAAMRQEVPHRPSAAKVDGGACKNDLLMQLQADLLETPVIRPRMVETTALGAAFLAGLAVGYWKSRDEIGRSWKMDRKFTPRMGGAARDRMHARWKWALERA
jgi:glycerol kinase